MMFWFWLITVNRIVIFHLDELQYIYDLAVTESLNPGMISDS